MTCRKIQIHWHEELHIRCSAQHNSSFLIHGWFYLMHSSIPSWFTNTFSRLAHTQFVDWITCLTTQRFLFQFLQTITFLPFRTCLRFIMSGHVSFLMFHSFAIFLSQCASAGSAEGLASTFLVTWPVHNLLIAWPASPYRDGFYRHFCQFIYVWV